MGSNEDKGTTKERTKDTSDSSKAMKDISNEDKGIYKGENEWYTKGEFWPLTLEFYRHEHHKFFAPILTIPQ